MNIDLRMPQFSGTDKEKIQQMHSYMYQLVEQLQWAFSNIESSSGDSNAGTTIIQQTITQNNENRPSTPEDAEATFAAIKNLIIKSADIVDAYYEKIDEKLTKRYVAQSDFGKYQETVDAEISKNAENITINQTKVETMSKVFQDGKTSAVIVKSSGYIKTGFLSEGAYGIEVGKISEDNVMQRSARFTQQEVGFYDENAQKSAWLSKRRLHATEVEAVERQQLGGFVDQIDPMTGDVTTRWVGKES